MNSNNNKDLDQKKTQGQGEQNQNQQKAPGGNKIDTDNDGKLRTKGDTSDHGDPRSPYGKQNQGGKKSTDEENEVEE